MEIRGQFVKLVIGGLHARLRAAVRTLREARLPQEENGKTSKQDLEART
jgi:hypothetical protein